MGNITLKALEFEGKCRQMAQAALEMSKALDNAVEVGDLWAQWSAFYKTYGDCWDGLVALKDEVRNCVENNFRLLDI